MTASANKCYSRCQKASGEEDGRKTLGKEIWRRKCGQWVSGLVEEDGDGSAGQSGWRQVISGP